MMEASRFWENSEWTPDEVKGRIERLYESVGYEWMTELLLSDDPKGDGTSGGISFDIPIEIELPQPLAEVIDVDVPPERGLELFLLDVDFIYEDYSEEEADPEWDPFRDVLSQWISQRISYLRTFQGINATQARVRAYDETQAVDLGGEELVCLTCGSFFWDNLSRLRDAERHYCSVTCQEVVEADCINCGTHYQVGRAKRGFRNYYKLNGFCDYDCYRSDWAKRTEDNHYIYGVRRRLEALGSGAVVDETVTRRAVFERADGICYLCGTETHWKMEGDWDPLLANLDHIKPVSKGGEHTWENVALACQLCNTRKGAQELSHINSLRPKEGN